MGGLIQFAYTLNANGSSITGRGVSRRTSMLLMFGVAPVFFGGGGGVEQAGWRGGIASVSPGQSMSCNFFFMLFFFIRSVLILGNTKTPNWYFHDFNDIFGRGLQTAALPRGTAQEHLVSCQWEMVVSMQMQQRQHGGQSSNNTAYYTMSTIQEWLTWQPKVQHPVFSQLLGVENRVTDDSRTVVVFGQALADNKTRKK